MARGVEVWMDDISLRSVSPKILLQRISEAVPQMDILYAANARGPGRRIVRANALSRKITLEIQIRETRDLPMRARIVRDINEWAAGHVLKTSNRPGQHLRVTCVALAAVGDARDYTDTMRVEFESSPIPYWQDDAETEISMSGQSGSGRLDVQGSAETVITGRVTPKAGTLGEMTITAGETGFHLAGLAATPSAPLEIWYDHRGYLAITAGRESCMPARAANSADDLIAQPPGVDVSFTADVACDVTLRARGRWN